MKKLFYKLVKPAVFKRFSNLKKKQKKRLQCVIEARNELSRWDDIPYSMQKGSINKILHLPKRMEVTKEFLFALTINSRYTSEDLASGLPLDWYD